MTRPHVLFAAGLALATTALTPAAAHALVDPARAAVDVDAALREGGYRFCKEPREPLSHDAVALCPHAAAIAGCEGFAAACGRREPHRWSFDWPPWLGRAAAWLLVWASRLVAWVLLPLLFVALLVPVVRALWRARRGPSSGDDPRDRPEPAPAALPVDAPGDETTLLARADAETSRRAYGVALELYLAASLVSLDRRGAIALARDRTNGEYVRACAEPDARTSLRALASEVDRVKFGGEPATSQGAERAGVAARAIVRGVAAAATALLLLACAGCGGPTWSGVPRPGDDPAGNDLLADVLRRQGFRVDPLGDALASLPLPQPGERAAAVVVDLDKTEVDEETAAHLWEWVGAGGSLVLAGIPLDWPKELGVTFVVAGEGARTVEARRMLARGAVDPSVYLDDDEEGDDDAPATDASPIYATDDVRGQVVLGEGLRAGAGSERVAWLDDGTDYAVAIPHGQGWVTVLASGELLTNAAMARPGNAAAALAVLSNADREELRIARPEDGVSPPSSPLAAIERAGLGLGLAHGLAAALLLFAAAGMRLARPRVEPPPSRRAFVEHVEAVGDLYLAGGHAAHALAEFARFADQRLRAKMPRGASDVPSFLAARARLPLEAATRLWARATSADPSSPRGDELGVLKELSAVYSAAVDPER